MQHERGKLDPVPDNWKDYLTEQQKVSLASLNNFGWTIAFIRRPLFMETTVVLHHDSQGYRLLEPTGFFDKPFYNLRDIDFS